MVTLTAKYHCQILYYYYGRCNDDNSIYILSHICQVTRFRRVTPGNRAVTLISLNTRRDTDFTTMTQNHPELVQILEIFIYLFGKYRDFTYRKDNNPNGQLQPTTIYLRGIK